MTFGTWSILILHSFYSYGMMLPLTVCKRQDLRSRPLQGGLEGRSPSKNLSMWAADGGFAAVSSPQKEIAGRLRLPEPHYCQREEFLRSLLPHPHHPHRGTYLGDHAPAIALVGACEHLTTVGAEV